MDEKFLYTRKYNKNPELNMWFGFPALYMFGMSSLGFTSIFKSIDELEHYNIERIFSDTKQTQIPLQNVDIFGFSCSFELDIIGILKLFDKYNLPYKAKDRDDTHPVLFAGGPVMTANPEPFADFFDFILLGDGESVESTILPTIAKYKHLKKQELLEKLSNIDGVYIPSIHNKSHSIKKCQTSLETCINTQILTEKTYFANTYIIEIARGCPMRCAFCLASYLNLPARFAPYEKIIQSIEFGLKNTNKIAFLGALITAHPDFDKICQYINKKLDEGVEIELSVSSLRADMISPQTVQTLVACGQRHSTIAIEAGSDRLRKVINKNLTETQILNTVKTVHENGLKGLKIYTMIGLPTETKEDIEDIIKLAKTIKSEYKTFDLTFSFSTFVPKAQTPFQFCSRETTKSLEEKYNYIKKHLSKYGVKVRCSSPAWDYIQAIISRGDRTISDFLIESYKNGGNIGAFKTAQRNYEKAYGKRYLDKIAQSEMPFDKELAWDFIASETTKKELIEEYKRLLG